MLEDIIDELMPKKQPLIVVKWCSPKALLCAVSDDWFTAAKTTCSC